MHFWFILYNYNSTHGAKNIKFFGISMGFVTDEVFLFHSFTVYIQHVRQHRNNSCRRLTLNIRQLLSLSTDAIDTQSHPWYKLRFFTSFA
jgi:hypothetical protein